MSKGQNNGEKISMEPYAGFVKQCRFNRYIIFWLVLVLHFLWGWFILFADRPLHHAPPLKHIFDDIHSTHFTAWMFIAASIIALFAVTKEFKSSFVKVIFLLPQQILLLWTALSAIAVCNNIGDWVTELPLILTTGAHTLVLLYNFILIPVVFKKR